MTPVNGHRYVAETDDARLALVTDCRDANYSALWKDIYAQDTEVTLHHTLKASRASAHLAAVFGCFARMLAVRLDISQSLSEQLLEVNRGLFISQYHLLLLCRCHFVSYSECKRSRSSYSSRNTTGTHSSSSASNVSVTSFISSHESSVGSTS